MRWREFPWYVRRVAKWTALLTRSVLVVSLCIEMRHAEIGASRCLSPAWIGRCQEEKKIYFSTEYLEMAVTTQSDSDSLTVCVLPESSSRK